MLCGVVAASVLLLAAHPVRGQSISQAFCGDDGKAHVVYTAGTTSVIHPEPKQVGCSYISIAEGKQTVGWAVLVKNCCESYPIAVALVVLRDGKKTVIRSPQMVWEWHFIEAGRRLALLSGPTHGRADEAGLYDAHSGKKLASWDGSDSPPVWAKAWQDDFSSEAK
jgi:hypothetical protein